MRKLFGGAGAAIAAKVVTGFAVAAFAMAAAGVATEAAVTGSLNPADWGQQVKHTVDTCKKTLRASGTRGIGQCVSAFAKQHGDLVSDEHASGPRTNHGKDNSSDKGKAEDNGKDKSKGGKGKGQGHGEPANKPDTTAVTVAGD